MTFKHWLNLNEDMKKITPQQAVAVLKNHPGVIKSDDVRYDFLKRDATFFFDNNFALSNIPRLTQGYDPAHVKSIINTIMKSIGLEPVADIRQIDRQALEPYLPQIKKSLPPIIVSLLPDDSYHIEDGNHRFGTAKLLGLQTIRAIILQ